MTSAASGKLADIAAADEGLRPYTTLLSLALAAAQEPVWAAAAVEVAREAPERLARGEPALHGQVLLLPRSATEALWKKLIGELPQPEAVTGRSRGEGRVEAGVATDRGLLASLADELALRETAAVAGREATVLQLALLPALAAAGQACAAAVDQALWQNGMCPVCAAWPALTESRGLDRARMLRCGRCGSEWKLPWQLCPFCANQDHASLSYLYSPDQGESRRVFTCERCHGYLKTLATIAAIEPAAVPVEDLATLELDIAAIDAGFQRPGTPGFALSVQLAWAE